MKHFVVPVVFLTITGFSGSSWSSSDDRGNSTSSGAQRQHLPTVPIKIAIILTKAEHQQITKDLDVARNKMLSDLKVPKLDKQQLWELYQQVYKKNPTWLEAIKPYFQP
jgi:hypothetical protein